MASKILTLNIGASSIALAEYELGAKPKLVNYGTAALAAPLDAGNAGTVLAPALLEIVREKGIKPGKVAIAVSGQMVFPRFAAIPFAGSDPAKFEQMVRYEVEQNVPFPIDEMICDRQVLGETENGDKSVMIVAAKIEQIEAITDAVVAAGFSPELVDVAPLALANVLKANRAGADDCAIILDIGAKTTSLVVVEGDKLYNRSIPVAGNTLTKEIAQKLGCTLDEAEQFKREKAYVSLGGVMEDDDPTLDTISKVCRAVMTRLNAEISRSMNFYRSQQGGGAPTKLYLTGGTALLPQLAEFFQDSLQIEVEFFNPFETIATGGAVDAAALETDAVFLGSTAGLALHAAGKAELAINLMPPSILASRAEVKRIPVVAAGAAALVAAAVCLLLAVGHGKSVVEAQYDVLEGKVSALKGYETKIKAAQGREELARAEAEALRQLIQRRGAAVAEINAVRLAIGEDLWIEKWEPGRVTLRGWKDRVAEFSRRNAGKTAPEIVVARLLDNPILKAESARVVDMSNFGKDDCVEQYVVEVKFQ